MRALILMLVALLPLGAAAQSLEKRGARRAEADGLLEQIRGGANVQQALSRLKYLGEEDYAAESLAEDTRALDVRRRRNVAFALAQLAAPSSEPLLLRMARDEDPVVRMSAAEGLGRIRVRNPAVLKPLLSDPNQGVRREAARALGRLRNPRASRPLLAAAQAEDDPEVRAVLLVSLGQSGDKRAIPALEKFLKASSETTRLAAAQGLCLLGAPTGRDFAKRILASTDRYERRQGLSLFEGADAKMARPVLEPLLKDADPSIAAAAARILYQGGDARMLEWLVVAAHQAQARDKLAYENELEPLHLTDEQRKAVQAKAGLR